jgi:hypothetical protein
MHESEKPGYLLINGSIPPMTDVVRASRTHHKTFTRCLKELLQKGVLREEGGAIVCPRMVKDQALREMKSRAGKMGGNPALLKQEDKPIFQKPEARKRKDTTAVSAFSLPEWMPENTWSLFLDHRKKVKAPVSEKAFPSFMGKFEKLKEQGWVPGRVVDLMVEKGWRWFNPTWLEKDGIRPEGHKPTPLDNSIAEERRALEQDRLENKDDWCGPEEMKAITKKFGLDFGKGRAET